MSSIYIASHTVDRRPVLVIIPTNYHLLLFCMGKSKRKLRRSENKVRKVGKRQEKNSIVATSSARQAPDTSSKSAKLYDLGDIILTVGDGDLSFSLGLLRRHGADNIFLQPTVYDSKRELLRKYPDTSSSNVRELSQKFKAQTKYNVDCCRLLESGEEVWRNLFSKIVFNFPHVGDDEEQSHHQAASVPVANRKKKRRADTPASDELPFLSPVKGSPVRVHQDLLLGFFRSARDCLAEDGEVHVALKTGEPYKSWKLPSLAKAAGLRLDRVVPFAAPGEYRHRRTNGLQYEQGRGFGPENIQNQAQVYAFKAKR